MSPKSEVVMKRLSVLQSAMTDSFQTTATRSGKPEGNRGSRNIVNRSPFRSFTVFNSRNQSTKSCSGPERPLRNKIPLLIGLVVESTTVIAYPRAVSQNHHIGFESSLPDHREA